MGSRQSRSKTAEQPSKKTSKKKIRSDKARCNHDKTEKQNGDLSGDRQPPLTASCSMEKIDGGPVKEYRMSRKGPVLIINNYAGNEKFEFRHGGALDGGKLQSCFEGLGFSKFHYFQNLHCDKMKTICHEFAFKQDFSQADCMVAVILTHGQSPDLLQGVDGEYVHMRDLFPCFHPSLIGKPKIIIIQACRGNEPNKPVRDKTSYPEEPKVTNCASIFPSFMPSNDAPSSKPQPSSGYLPRQADRVEAFATGIGHPAYRSPEKGSWYIEELTKALYEEYAGRSKKRTSSKARHFLDVLTEVQGRVSNYTTIDNCVQMPEFRSTLRGPIYFNTK